MPVDLRRLGALALAVAIAIESGSILRGSQGQLGPASPTGGQSSSPVTTSPLGLAPLVPVVRGRYLDVVTSVSWGTGAASGPLTLIADITPKPGMRVYAPGNKDYTAVQLNVDARPDHTIAPTKYPKPNVYLFAPLKERVQVFDGVFRLSRDVTRRSGRVSAGTVTGRLEYQACDDSVCYLPQTLSLTWTVAPN